MTLIVIPCKGNGGLNSSLSPLFGRCECFTFITLEGDKIIAVKTVPNTIIKGEGNYGVHAANLIETYKAEILITEHLGVNAFDKLLNYGLKIFQAPKDIENIKEIITLYLKEGLNELKEATKGPYSKHD